MIRKNNKIIFFFIIVLICALSLLVIKISYDEQLWLSFWRYLQVPSMWPAFADIDHIYRSLLCKQQGINPFYYNPCEISGTRYQYPITWLIVFEFLNINNLLNLKIFLFFSLSMYALSYVFIFQIIKKKINKIILILLFFSPSSLLVIERGNVDHIIFIICILSMMSKKYYVEICLVFLNSCLKVYPIFNFIFFLQKKNIILTVFLFGFTIFILYSFALSKYLNPNHSFIAMSQSYGVLSMVEGIFKILEKKYDIYFDFNTKTIVRFFSILFFIAMSFLLFFVGIKSYKKKDRVTYNCKKLFIFGSSIYVGSYIFFGNLDYRLIFLFMTMPYISTLKNKQNYIYCFMVVIVSSSWFFSFVPLTAGHYIYTFFIYLIKFVLFLYLSYLLGMINKNFFKKVFNI